MHSLNLKTQSCTPDVAITLLIRGNGIDMGEVFDERGGIEARTGKPVAEELVSN
jgi:hypothetical protein